MRFLTDRLEGIQLVAPDRLEDDRGYFARTFCRKEFSEQGLVCDFIQTSMARTWKAGTVRGLHFQRHPHWETKLVSCSHGAAYVVVVDLRPNSATFLEWGGYELSPENGIAIYVPVGFAQGYQALSDNTEIQYRMAEAYHPESASGVRYNDPAF